MRIACIGRLALAVTIAAAGAGSLGAMAQKREAGQVSPADEGKRIEARHGVVTSANGLASEAGVEVLKAGGNAIDAAVATAFAIGVVEPQMSGLGGGGAATVWMKRQRRADYIDFYPAQLADSWKGHTEPPAGQRPAGQPAPPRDPHDLRTTGIPGDVAGLLALHEKYGALPRERVMAPAIRLADEGFAVGDVLAGFVADQVTALGQFPAAAALFVPEGKPLGPGATLRNPELAESLRRIAREGRRGFYEGPLAQAVIEALHAGRHPGTTTEMSAYAPRWKRPLCIDYRGRAVLSAPPPQTGLQVLHTLQLLEPFELKAMGLPTRSAAAFDALVSALRVGQAAASGNNDPNWARVPANGISSSAFAAERRSLVGTRAPAASIPVASAVPFDRAAPENSCAAYDPYGPSPDLPGIPTRAATAGSAEERGGETTHISVVDDTGNAVALTQTNSSVFGSKAFVAGFFLNDSGYLFTDATIDAPSLSRWRVRSTTIAPTIVMKGTDVQMVIGAPGSGRIPTEIVQVMVYTLDYGLDPLDAVRMPRIYPAYRNRAVQVEHGFTPQLLREVRAMGYDPVRAGAEYARLYFVVRRDGKWIGVADTRHDGQPRGY